MTPQQEAEKQLEQIRLSLVKKVSTLQSGFPKTNTKKFEYHKGFCDCIVAFDNAVLEIDALSQSNSEPYGYVFEGRFYKSLVDLGDGYTCHEFNKPIAVYANQIR